MIRILTRQSPLALWQAEYAMQQLTQHNPALTCQLQPMTTEGDQAPWDSQHDPSKALFVKNIEVALLRGDGDLAVHSMKDMSVHPTPGLLTFCLGERGNPLDALVTQEPISDWQALPKGATVGTASLRRQAFLKRLRPDLNIKPIRGNLGTRLARCDNGDVNALVLAAAGLERLGLASRIVSTFSADAMLPAACQGMLAAQCRTSNKPLVELLSALANPTLQAQANAERTLCLVLGANCHTPIGAYATPRGNDQLELHAWVATLDGNQCLKVSDTATLDEAQVLGERVGQALLAKGAGALLA